MCRTQYVLALVALFLALAQSWDIAITAGDRLEFYTTNGSKKDTIRFDSQNLTAIAYDEVHNMLLYVDKQSDNDAICGYNISAIEYKCYIERNGRNIQGIAFDPITEMLFFTDTKERSINWISFKPGFENNVNGNLLIKMAKGIPTDIAVDSCRGYIYWVNTNLTWSTIERARFNGSEREVVRTSKYKYFDQHSLAIDQQTQKIYWIVPETLGSHIYSKNLTGKNKSKLVSLGNKTLVTRPNTLTISKDSVFMVDWCSSCDPIQVWEFPKHNLTKHSKISFFNVHSDSLVGIVAKYKISDQIQGVQDCKKLTSQVPNTSNYATNNSFKIAKEYVEPFCEHGTKVNGQPLCKCTPGYRGKRCDVSVCENYCFQGICSFNEKGLPKCRCISGYSGERCEVNVCHRYCSNNGTCSLNEGNEPVCQCLNDYAGDRCDVPVCLNATLSSTILQRKKQPNLS